MPACGNCHREAAPGALFCAFCGSPILPDQAPGEPKDPYIGQLFRNTYFVQQKVGGGGMGQVYRAVHVTLDAPVALKILNKALLADPAIVTRFYREARAASRLRHHNVISVTDFGQTDDGTLFMAMEYVAGKSLARAIAEEFPLSEQRVVGIGVQILDALAEAHANQILHRDLKPENVMLASHREQRDVVKVLDFGIAKIQLPGDGEGLLTQAGLVCGTPGYMSPEQWNGTEVDGRSDLYSVGVILYEMLTGRRPFESQTPMELLRKHLTETPLPPSARVTDRTISPDLDAVVMRALSMDREQRAGSAEEMRNELLACALSPERANASPSQPTLLMPPGSPAGTPKATRRPGAATPWMLGAGHAASAPGARATPAPLAGRATPAVTNGDAAPRRGTPRPRLATPPPSEPMAASFESDPDPRPFRREETEQRLPLVAIAVAAVVVALLVTVGLVRWRGRSVPPTPPVTAAPAPPPGGGDRQRAEPSTPQQQSPAPIATQERPPAVPAPAIPSATGEETAGLPVAPPPREKTPPPRQVSPGRKPDAKRQAAGGEPDRKRVASRTPERSEAAARPSVVRDSVNAIPLPPAESGDGLLAVMVQPFGDVLVDGVAYGEAPKEFQLPAGLYSVRVMHPQFPPLEKQVEVMPGRRNVWRADFLDR